MIRTFTELTTDLKTSGINPGIYFMDKEAFTALNMAITTMYINDQLVPPGYHKTKNAEREIQTFKNTFIAGLCSIDEILHLQLCDRLL